MTNSIDAAIKIVQELNPDAKLVEHRNQISLTIPREKLIETARKLKESEETCFDTLTDVTAIDWYKETPRFEVVYFLWSNKYKSRIRLKVPLEEKDLKCPTLVQVWESANWYERETYDMYGIKFEGHPNLRRFYMPEDFTDPETGEALHPLRKDFPLMGIPGSLPLPPYPERDGELEDK